MIMTVTAPQSRSQRGAFISAINITHLPSLRSLSSLLLLFLSRLGSSGSGLLLRSSLLGFLRLIGSLLLFDFTVEKEKIEYEYPGRECKTRGKKYKIEKYRRASSRWACRSLLFWFLLALKLSRFIPTIALSALKARRVLRLDFSTTKPFL
jgi:hypothetical protein